jgi:Protein of unknown function (DUF3619)
MTTNFTSQNNLESQLASRWVQGLDASLETMPHHISERLRVARQKALGLHRVKLKQAASHLHVQAGVATLSGPEEEPSLWNRLASYLPLLVLLAGLIGIQEFQNDSNAHKLANLDQALLLDDLPPDAYTDPGFLKFLSTPNNAAPTQP